MEVGEGGSHLDKTHFPLVPLHQACHHRSHHAPLAALLLAAIASSQVAVVGQAQDVALREEQEHRQKDQEDQEDQEDHSRRATSSCARMKAEESPSSLLREQERSGSQAPETGA